MYVGNTNTDICPVAAMLTYLTTTGVDHGPLFTLPNRVPLAKSRFTKQVQATLTQAGIEASHYKGHSFRIGAATTAAANGLPDHMIKKLGRWSSAAYQAYIRTAPHVLASASAQLH